MFHSNWGFKLVKEFKNGWQWDEVITFNMMHACAHTHTQFCLQPPFYTNSKV